MAVEKAALSAQQPAVFNELVQILRLCQDNVTLSPEGFCVRVFDEQGDALFKALQLGVDIPSMNGHFDAAILDDFFRFGQTSVKSAENRSQFSF